MGGSRIGQMTDNGKQNSMIIVDYPTNMFDQ